MILTIVGKNSLKLNRKDLFWKIKYATNSHMNKGIIYVNRPSFLKKRGARWIGIQKSGITGQNIRVAMVR
jgi:hypothetical protein